MVALDNSALFSSNKFPRLKFILGPLVAGITVVAIALVLGAIQARGFSENGFRLGTQFAWRYASFVFFAGLVADPACRLGAHFFPAFQAPDSLGRRLIWG